MNGHTAAASAASNAGQLLSFPGLINIPSEPRKLSWWMQFLYDLGVIEMEDEPTRPPGIHLTYQTAMFYLAVIGAIVGCVLWTWNQADIAGYQRGRQEAEKEQLQKQIDAQAAELKQVKEVQRLIVNQPDDPKEKK